MKRADEPLPGPGRYTVDAAAKALELLSAFSFHERRLSLSELAARTGIPRATAFRLLSTLEAARFVAKVAGEYQLGLKCFMLGNIVASDLDLREIARPHLVALRDRTRETTQIAILDRSEEHTSELQSHSDLVCRLLLEKKKDVDMGMS